MAGSIKWMIYRSDNGSDYAVRIDESNGELLGFDDYTDDTPNLPTVKQAGIQMRYISVLSPTFGIKRKLYVGKPNNDYYLAGGVLQLLIAVSGVSAALHPFLILSAFPERKASEARPYARDTFLTDGDDT